MISFNSFKRNNLNLKGCTPQSVNMLSTYSQCTINAISLVASSLHLIYWFVLYFTKGANNSDRKSYFCQSTLTKWQINPRLLLTINGLKTNKQKSPFYTKHSQILSVFLYSESFLFFGSHFDSLGFYQTPLWFAVLHKYFRSKQARYTHIWCRGDYWTQLRRHRDSEETQMKPSIICYFPANSHAHTHTSTHTHTETARRINWKVFLPCLCICSVGLVIYYSYTLFISLCLFKNVFV